MNFSVVICALQAKQEDFNVCILQKKKNGYLFAAAASKKILFVVPGRNSISPPTILGLFQKQFEADFQNLMILLLKFH